MFNEIIAIAKGNHGALNCIMGIIEGSISNSVAGLTIIPAIKEYEIFGDDLYVFWSDICNKDYQKMAKLCKTVPSDLLKEACSRQDYSGRNLLKDYLQ